jgi:mono/diheme cytochrome c family protein
MTPMLIRSFAAAALLLPLMPAAAQGPATPSDPAFASPVRFLHRDGAALYAASCAGCHMPDGRGAQGAAAYPALAGNPRLDPPDYLLSVIVKGRHGMQGFGGLLDDAQIAAVATFVRGNLGNDHRDAITPEQVRAAR